MPMPSDMRARGDRGDIVLGWLARVIGVLTVLGVLGFDAISLTTTRFAAEDHARTAAREAAATYAQTRALQAAYDAALAQTLPVGETVDAASFTANAEGEVTLTLHRTAPTLLLERIRPLRDWATMSVTATAAAPAG